VAKAPRPRGCHGGSNLPPRQRRGPSRNTPLETWCRCGTDSPGWWEGLSLPLDSDAVSEALAPGARDRIYDHVPASSIRCGLGRSHSATPSTPMHSCRLCCRASTGGDNRFASRPRGGVSGCMDGLFSAHVGGHRLAASAPLTRRTPGGSPDVENTAQPGVRRLSTLLAMNKVAVGYRPSVAMVG
jgi:hypothetical protein